MDKRAASARKRSKTMSESAKYLYLPDDCWKHIFKFLNDGDNDYLKSISAVSKEFFSITNRLRSSLTIHDPTAPFLSRILHRFTDLTSLDFTHFHGDLDALLCQIPPLNNLTSLNLSHKKTIPSDGLRYFSKKITTLTSLTCSNLFSFTSTHLFLIADCFPLLQELNLGHVIFTDDKNDTNFLDGIEALSLSLSQLRKLNLSSHSYVTDKSIFHLFKNCKFLEEVIITECFQLTAAGVASALIEKKQTMLKTLCLPGYIITPQVIDSLVSLKRLTCIDLSFSRFRRISDDQLSYIGNAGLPLRRIDLSRCTGYSYAGLFSLLSKYQSIQHLDFEHSTVLNDRRVVKLSSFLLGLVSINLSYCTKVTYSTLFALVKKCPSLSEIKMQHIKHKRVKNYDLLTDFGVYPQLKSLDLSLNLWLRDKGIILFASVFPNLQLLDLSSCEKLSDEGILQVLRRCSTISHLNVWGCSIENIPGLNFEVPKLKMLNLSFTDVEDEALFAISKSCRGLLQLLLSDCYKCTEMGVKYVLENCTQLKEIDLSRCSNVHTNVVASMLSLRPSLRKITAPPDFCISESEKNLFLLQGCILFTEN
ncbi:F-box/LRR-repeat protein 2-like [Trifolium pratense]|uniref:F-box/LRR-repeat protein 2-like n=1 Tax=Trifolium pratense TaxID=57577 RepID=UPI001E696648|nr:F-box/LRR-repeat protein 2-like [Trifolium pratense]